MEVYVEIKQCYLTTYNPAEDTDEFSMGSWLGLPRFMRFIDKKCGDYWNITDDYKYVYCYYNREPSFFRVVNICSKPIQKKNVIRSGCDNI